MKEFIEKLIGRLEELRNDKYMNGVSRFTPNEKKVFDIAETIVNRLAEEYNNDFCEWGYDEFEEKWQTDCGVLFALHDSDREITHFCPCCGKEIKIAPYQPEGE